MGEDTRQELVDQDRPTFHRFVEDALCAIVENVYFLPHSPGIGGFQVTGTLFGRLTYT